MLSLGTAMRNIAAATVVAADAGEPDTLVLVVVASILALLVLIPVARWLRRRSGKRAAAERARQIALRPAPPWTGPCKETGQSAALEEGRDGAELRDGDQSRLG